MRQVQSPPPGALGDTARYLNWIDRQRGALDSERRSNQRERRELGLDRHGSERTAAPPKPAAPAVEAEPRKKKRKATVKAPKPFLSVGGLPTVPGIRMMVRKNGKRMVRLINQGGLPHTTMDRIVLLWIAEQVTLKKTAHERGKITERELRTVSLRPRDVFEAFGIKYQSERLKTFRQSVERLETTLVWYGTPVKWRDVKARADAEDSDYEGVYHTLFKRSRVSASGRTVREVTISRFFMRMILRAPVPLRLKHLRRLRRSAFAMDLYSFVSWRSYALSRGGSDGKGFAALPLLESRRGKPGLISQIGSVSAGKDDEESRRNWLRQFRHALKKIRVAVPTFPLRPGKRRNTVIVTRKNLAEVGRGYGPPPR